MDLNIFINVVRSNDYITVVRSSTDYSARVLEVTGTDIKVQMRNTQHEYNWKFADIHSKGIRLYYGDEEVIPPLWCKKSGKLRKAYPPRSEKNKQKISETQLMRWAKIREEKT